MFYCLQIQRYTKCVQLSWRPHNQRCTWNLPFNLWSTGCFKVQHFIGGALWYPQLLMQNTERFPPWTLDCCWTLVSHRIICACLYQTALSMDIHVSAGRYFHTGSSHCAMWLFQTALQIQNSFDCVTSMLVKAIITTPWAHVCSVLLWTMVLGQVTYSTNILCKFNLYRTPLTMNIHVVLKLTNTIDRHIR